MESPTYALFNAVEEGDVERVQQAMEAGADANPDDGRNAFQGTNRSSLI
jgi:microcompartment protein CcmL/EutN